MKVPTFGRYAPVSRCHFFRHLPIVHSNTYLAYLGSSRGKIAAPFLLRHFDATKFSSPIPRPNNEGIPICSVSLGKYGAPARPT